MNRYAMVVFWSDEDRCWVADAPDLKSCSALGDTAGAAVAELEVAIEAWLRAAEESGHQLPPPRFRGTLEAAE
jgi:predicted RNase H-like HicB family nuclease